MRFRPVAATATPAAVDELCLLYRESVNQRRAPCLVQVAISAFSGSFTLADLERACPAVSRDMIRRVLTELRQQKVIECVGRGPGAFWRRLPERM